MTEKNWTHKGITLGEQVSDGIVTAESDWLAIECEADGGVVLYCHESRWAAISQLADAAGEVLSSIDDHRLIYSMAGSTARAGNPTGNPLQALRTALQRIKEVG